MTRSIRTSIVFLLFAFLLHDSFAYQKAKARVQSRSVTGTYKYMLNSLEVLELPDHKVRISFTGFWPNDRKRVETRNMGSFDETVPLNGRTAVVKPKYGDPDNCAITLEFRANRVIVVEEGYRCGFGFNVEADGTYVKVSSKPPDLPPREPDQSLER